MLTNEPILGTDTTGLLLKLTFRKYKLDKKIAPDKLKPQYLLILEKVE